VCWQRSKSNHHNRDPWSPTVTGFQTEVRRHLRTPDEIAAERLANSPVGRLIEELRQYADGRTSDVRRGAETPALASLMVEKFGYGLSKAAVSLGVSDSALLTAEVDRLVVEIDPDHRQQRTGAERAALRSIGAPRKNH
jgi:hypothetical protein